MCQFLQIQLHIYVHMSTYVRTYVLGIVYGRENYIHDAESFPGVGM